MTLSDERLQTRRASPCKCSGVPFYYFLLPIHHGRGCIVFGSNSRNGGFDGFIRFELLLILLKFLFVVQCVYFLQYKRKSWFRKNFQLPVFHGLYTRRKYWIRENFRPPVFDGLTCFEMSWTRLDHF